MALQTPGQRAKRDIGGPLTFLSAFSGCGGFDAGFEAERFRCVGAFDIDPTAIAVHRRNLRGPAAVCDLSIGLPQSADSLHPDVLLAGSPCQGFSTIGQRKLDDPRNDLLLAAGRMALAVRPTVFIAENVAGVRSGPHSKFWFGLSQMLRAADYRTIELVVDVTTVGLPQRRRRVLLVAWNNGVERSIEFPQQTPTSLRHLLENLDGVLNHDPVALAVGTPAAQIAARIGPGQKLSNVRASPRSVHTWNIPEVFGATTHRERVFLAALLRERRRNRVRDFGDADPVTASTLRASVGNWADAALVSLIAKGYIRRVKRRFDLRHTFNGNYRRLAWDEPSPTVDTKFGEPRLFLHPEECRGFTVREAARIQGFPDSFAFEGPRRGQFEMVGNAVPPPLGATVARWIRAALL